MLLKFANKFLKLSGYRLSPADDVYIKIDNIFSNSTKNAALFSYTKEDGTFDYERYKSVQEEGNKNKIHQVWALEENMAFLSRYLKEKVSPLNFGLCHGTRRGKEQEWFNKHISDNVKVIGTEISETASQFPNTIQWDFHEVEPEWVDSVDFIYSNSFDHSYDPEKCLNAWMSCIRPGGVCILEHTDHHETDSSRELDPFGAYLVQMPLLISKWGGGRYGVREILKAPIKKDAVQYVAFIVIERY